MPTNLEAASRLAELALMRGDTDQAREAYGRAYRTHRDHPSGFQYMLLALKAGEIGKAEQVAEDLAAANYQPNQIGVIVGSVRLQQGRNERPCRSLRRRLPNQPCILIYD